MRVLAGHQAGGQEPKIARVLHPSPASPAANRGWAEAATAQLRAAGVWL
jgi:single-strand selective monofunctional uracil DNA glycosylase